MKTRTWLDDDGNPRNHAEFTGINNPLDLRGLNACYAAERKRVVPSLLDSVMDATRDPGHAPDLSCDDGKRTEKPAKVTVVADRDEPRPVAVTAHERYGWLESVKDDLTDSWQCWLLVGCVLAFIFLTGGPR
jgi:hypothetical protein